MTKILLVDDEETIHRALERTFRREPYEIVHAYDASEAQAVLDGHPEIQAVICDHYMPGTPGLDFLMHMRRRRPATVAILLTAQADLQMVITAMNEGQLHRFFTKPWDGDELRGALRKLLGADTPAESEDLLHRMRTEEARLRRELLPSQDESGAYMIEPPDGD